MTSHTQNGRVLIVGEANDEREMYSEALRLEGFCTLQAATEAAAIRLVDELHPSVVVISNGRLDTSQALDLVRHVKLENLRTAPPVVVLTTHARQADLDTARRAGCDRVVLKPCTPDLLGRILDDLLGSGCSVADRPRR